MKVTQSRNYGKDRQDGRRGDHAAAQGSDMGDGVTGGGLMGKDLSKADVSVNIACHLKAVASGQVVTAICSIGDENVTFTYADGKTETMLFADIVEQARQYIQHVGGFEKFAEWGLVRPLAQV